MLVFTGIQLFINCSNPLDLAGQDGLSPVGPTTEVDTVFSTDTLIIEGDTLYVYDTVIIDGDTIYTVDTLIVTDTLTVVDTVVIVEPGPGETQTVCSILLSNLYEIIWMFHNAEGDYTLTFTAEAARDFDFRTVTVDIDGQQYTWCPVDEPEVVYEQHLGAYATIRIMTDQPCLQGHEVDICLTIGKTE